jgi:organic hydroperoxide reductase OsmC/OhrA
MSSYTAVVTWERAGAVFSDNRYSRAHRWTFDGGVTVPASSSPHVLPAPMSRPDAVDPEEAFVASLSSCHMLTFLWIAARRGYVVERYHDEAVGELSKDGGGQLAMTSVVLRPHVTFAGGAPDAAAHEAMHHEAHDQCFIARSVKTDVRCEPVTSADLRPYSAL